MKKQVLHIDKHTIRTANAQAPKQAGILNDFITETEEYLKTSFSPEDRVKLKENAGSFLREWVKPLYQFPNATPEFNLQALGIDLKGIISDFNKKSKEWNKYLYTVEDGIYTYNEKATI